MAKPGPPTLIYCNSASLQPRSQVQPAFLVSHDIQGALRTISASHGASSALCAGLGLAASSRAPDAWRLRGACTTTILARFENNIRRCVTFDTVYRRRQHDLGRPAPISPPMAAELGVCARGRARRDLWDTQGRTTAARRGRTVAPTPGAVHSALQRLTLRPPKRDSVPYAPRRAPPALRHNLRF